MDERTLFDRLHQALDVEVPSGAYERLRTALSSKPVKRQNRLAFPMKWPQMGLRLAAVMTVVVIAIAATAAFLLTHSVADRGAPADSDQAIAAYKAMVADDYIKVTTAAAAWTCNDGSQFAACESDASRLLPAANKFLSDLNRFHTPSRFAVADAQLRRHIIVQTSRATALIAASRAQDAAAAAREVAAIQGETGDRWGQQMVSSILRSRRENAATYVETVRSEKQALDGCIECQGLAGQNQISCTVSQAATCQDLVDTTARQVRSFQAAVVVIGAPSSLTAKDSHLQLDLGEAEIAVKAMVDALATRDQAGLDTGRISFRHAMAALNRDAADILNS